MSGRREKTSELNGDCPYIAEVVATRPEIVKLRHVVRKLGRSARLMHTVVVSISTENSRQRRRQRSRHEYAADPGRSLARDTGSRLMANLPERACGPGSAARRRPGERHNRLYLRTRQTYYPSVGGARTPPNSAGIAPSLSYVAVAAIGAPMPLPCHFSAPHVVRYLGEVGVLRTIAARERVQKPLQSQVS